MWRKERERQRDRERGRKRDREGQREFEFEFEFIFILQRLQIRQDASFQAYFRVDTLSERAVSFISLNSHSVRSSKGFMFLSYPSTLE